MHQKILDMYMRSIIHRYSIQEMDASIPDESIVLTSYKSEVWAAMDIKIYMHNNVLYKATYFKNTLQRSHLVVAQEWIRY